MPDLFSLRPGRETDFPFVVSSWLASDRHSPSGRDMGGLYYDTHRETVRRVLMRAELRVACVPDSDDAIMGWAAVHAEGDTPAVFYVYVRRDARRLGIARSLLGELLSKPCDYTHRPVVHAPVKMPEGWRYNPVRNYR